MAKEETRQSAKETLRLFILDSLFQQERYFTKTELTEKLEVYENLGKKTLARYSELYLEFKMHSK